MDPTIYRYPLPPVAGCLIVFMVYILSRIADKFCLRSAALAFKEHSDFALLGADHNRLISNLLYQYHPALLRKKESMRR